MEEWREIPGYEGLYEASSDGRVRTLVAHPKGRTPAGHVLKARMHGNGYLNVGLSRDGRRRVIGVHRLVASAFHGSPEPGWEARHRDNCKVNNAAANLMWGTHAENVRDTVRAGRHYSHGRSKTHCVHGHEFSERNTAMRVYSDGCRRRVCLTCAREKARRYRRRAGRTRDVD